MLQIDHVYEFFYQEIFQYFSLYHLPKGVPCVNKQDLSINDISVFTPGLDTENKIFFYDQEPLISPIVEDYLKIFSFPDGYSVNEILEMNKQEQLPYNFKKIDNRYLSEILSFHPSQLYKKKTLVTSEKSPQLDILKKEFNLSELYYFFHGFAALDWFRGYYALNYSKKIVKTYDYDFISYNRIIHLDRSYRIYFVSLLNELQLLDRGKISFAVTDYEFTWQDELADKNTKISPKAQTHIKTHLSNINKLIIDTPSIHGSASANIPRTINDFEKNGMNDVDALWHIVTESVFYYDKLHLTEKIFKPIVNKQPFMLLAAPGNLEYLRSYGFKTFDGIIDENYDTILDNDQRIEAVVDQINWYCNLSESEKAEIIRQIEPIVEYNFHHFYGKFKYIITQELIDNCRKLFKELGYNDQHINYSNIYHVLIN